MLQYLLSLLILTPLLAALIGLFIPSKGKNTFFWLAILASLLQLAFLVIILVNYDHHQFIEKYNWIYLDLGSWGILKAEYFLGIDGLSLPLVALAVPIMLIATISSRSIDKNV